MIYLLDTNICIYYLNGKYGLRDRINKAGFENFSISEITLAELYYGAENSEEIEKNITVVNNFTGKISILPIFGAIRIYAKEKARLKKKGTMISDFDLLIGSTAIANNFTLVTRNVKEFCRMDNLKYENWIDD